MESREEQELRSLSVQLRIHEQNAENIQTNMNMINSIIADLSYASMALEGLEAEKENSEILVTVGGNSYIRAKLVSPDKVIVGMGAGVSVEKTLPEAKEILKKRLENLDKNRQMLQQQFAQVAQRMNDDRERFEGLLGKLREGKPAKDV